MLIFWEHTPEKFEVSILITAILRTMRKADITPDFLRPKLFDHIVNQSFPDELYDIGSKVYITGLSDVEFASVKKSDSHFVIKGTAKVETQTDMGEGDSLEDSYPMSFEVELDEDGRIAKQNSLSVDTSSFFE